MVNIENLIRLATLVRDETANKQNTALRVGGTFLEVIYAIRYLLETVGELDTLAKGLDNRTRFFHGYSADVDALKNKTDLGVYVAIANGWTGLLSVQFDFYFTVSQVALSSSTPDYSEGSLVWKPAPCVMSRTYSDGTWSQWRKAGADVVNDLVTGGIDRALSAEQGKFLKQDFNGLAKEMEDVKATLNILVASLGEYAFPAGKPAIGNTFVVTQQLDNVTSNYASGSVTRYAPLTVSLSPAEKYKINEVKVFVGETDVTSTAYDKNTYAITIPRVTGNVTIMASAVKSAAAYVQTGLVFQMDGLEQGDYADGWEDLINGVRFTSNGATRLSNGWYFDGSSFLAGDSNMQSYDPALCTIEICFESELSNTGYFIFADADGALVFNYTHNYTSLDLYITKGKSVSSTAKYGGLSTAPSDGGYGKRIISYNGGLQAVSSGYVNGVAKNGISINYGAVSGSPRIGARGGTSPMSFKGTVHALRIYNRALTLAEMLENQKIDNERFGFGLTI